MAAVSIIIPVYNVEKYIRQCLDSVMNQTFKDIEVILVDDGSPDNSPAICDEYAQKDSRFKVIHKENGGVSDARNHGIEAATGEWMYLVDSDDWLEEDTIEKLYKIARKQEVDCVLTDCVERYSSGRNVRLRMFSQRFRSDDPKVIADVQKAVLCHKYSPYYQQGADNEYPAPWSKFFKTSIIKENNIRFDPYVMGYYDDGLFTMRLFEHVKSIYYCGRHSYNYRIVEESIMHGFRAKSWSCNIRNCEKMDEFIKETGKDEDFKQAEYCRRVSFFAALLSAYFFNPNNPDDLKSIRKAVRKSLDEYPYAIAFKKAKTVNLEPKHQYVLLCGKMKFIPGLEAYARLKRKYKPST